jgi:CDP-diacylglycerol--glycerol-3-phosphate 3-phosphatidyltransferase
VADPVVTWDEYAVDWAGLHGGADPRRARPWVRTWLRIGFVVARWLRGARVQPGTVTGIGLLASAAAPVLVTVGNNGMLVAAAFVALAVLADTVDGALAVLSGRTTRLGYVYDAVVDRLGEACWLIALWRVGAGPAVVIAAGALAWLHEYIRTRSSAAGMTEITETTVGERPTRVLVTIGGLVLADISGFIDPNLPAGIAAFATATWIVLGLIGIVQLLAAVHRTLAGKEWPRRREPQVPSSAQPSSAQPSSAQPSSSGPSSGRTSVLPSAPPGPHAPTYASPAGRSTARRPPADRPVGTAVPPANADRPGSDRPENPERRTQPARTGLGQWFSRRIRPGEPETAAAAGAGERDTAPDHVDAGVDDDSVWSRREGLDESDGDAYSDLVLREPSLDDLLGDAGARVRGAVGRAQPTTAVYSSQYASTERMRIVDGDSGADRDTREDQASRDDAYRVRGDQGPRDDRVHDGRNSRDSGGSRDAGSTREGSGAPRSATHRDRPSRRQQARKSADGRTMPAEGGSTGGAGGISGGGAGGGGGGDGT